MSDQFVAEIRLFGFNFAPHGWAQCNGQILPISQNTALFSLLGTWYGGDGKSTFALPNLMGSVPIGEGQSTTGTQYYLGETAGSATVSLIQSEMPYHTHTASASTDNDGQVAVPSADVGLGDPASGKPYRASGADAVMAGETLSVTGASAPHNNLMPYTVVNYCIALTGFFPPRP